MEKEIIVTLPAEVEVLAQNLSVEKRSEVQAVLNHIFNGVAEMRTQLDNVNVKDENDKVSMKMANTIRLGVRQVRLNGEKEFEAKRSEVQAQMLSFKTEDALWLKSKQTMQILIKEIEELAKWKEDTKERVEAERKELKTQQRILEVSKFNSELSRYEFENMSDEMFTVFISGLESSYNAKIEEEQKAEAERLRLIESKKIHELRKCELLDFWQFVPYANRDDDFSTLTDEEWKERFEWTKKQKTEFEDKQAKIKAENEALRIESERKEKELEAERKKQAEKLAEQKRVLENRNNELRPYIVFIRDYNKMIDMSESDYQKEFIEIKKGAELKWKFEREEMAKKAQKENEERAHLLKVQKQLQEKQKVNICSVI